MIYNNVDNIDYLKKFIAKVKVYDAAKEVITTGTGFFIDKETLVTAHHVIISAIDSDCVVKVQYFYDGIETEIPARILFTSPASDINVLTLCEPANFDVGINFPKIVKNSFKKREFKYAAFGFPMVKPGGHYEHGILLDQSKSENGDILLDVSLGEGRLDNYFGYSGSPIVCNGQLIGIAIEQTTGLKRSQSIKVLCLHSLNGLISDSYFCEDTFIKKIINTFNQESEKEIENNKNNKKYVPEIYVEIDNMKDYLRSFTDPVLFFRKHLEYNKKHSLSYFNRLLRLYGLKEIESLKDEFEVDLGTLYSIVDTIIEKLDNSLEYIEKLSNYSEIKKDIPGDKLDLFEASYYTTRPILLRHEIEDRKTLFEAIKNKQILLTERAGQGKTNLLCDLVENVLLKKEIPCLFLGARSIANNDLGNTILSLVDDIKDIELLFDALNYYAFIIKKPFVIVIDAINEQKDISEAKHKLYYFLNYVKNYENIRILLTARTEYFEEKFGDIITECPQVMRIDSYNRRSQSSKYKNRIFKGYLKHFNIEINSIDDNIFDQLTEDYLLLRMFSEAYQGETNNINAIPSLQHLFRYEIFERYYNYKKRNLEDWDRLRGIIDTSSTYDALIKFITSYMLDSMVFSNIERSSIVGQIQNELLVKLIDEDIIFREDIEKKKGLLNENIEVINFTFDEFRDFCIAKFILEKFDKTNPKATEEMVSKLTNKELEIAEGVQKYLFFACKKYPDELFEKILERQDWYNHVYTYNIFSIDDEYITKDDISLITGYLKNEKTLKRSESLNAYIVMNLYKRIDIDVYKKLNIRTLNMALQCSGDCFKYFRQIFKPTYEDRYSTYYSHNPNHLPVDKIVPELKRKMTTLLNEEVVILLSFLNYKGVYIHEFFDWCIESHKYQFISIIESILESKNYNIIEPIKSIVRGLSYYKIKGDVSLQKRWKTILGKCQYKQDNIERKHFSNEELEKLIKNLWRDK